MYEVNDEMLEWLDDFEDTPYLYKRHSIMVWSKSKSIECSCYFLVKWNGELLELPYMENYDSYGAHGKQYLSELDEDYYG